MTERKELNDANFLEGEKCTEGKTTELPKTLEENPFFNSRCLIYCEYAQSLRILKRFGGHIHSEKLGSNTQKK